jgi:hypothetical protein
MSAAPTASSAYATMGSTNGTHDVKAGTTANLKEIKYEQEGDEDTRGESSEPAQQQQQRLQQPKVKKRRLGVDPSLIISEERSKRRRTPTPEPEQDDKDVVHDPKDPQRAKELGLQIYQKIMDAKDSECVASDCCDGIRHAGYG